MSKTIKILGVGSPFGDDKVGWEVVEKLRKCPEFQYYLNKSLFIKSLNRPHLNLLREFNTTDVVYIIDAMLSDQKPGVIKHFSLEDICSDNKVISTHDFGVIQSLRLGKVLNLLPSHLSLYGVEIKEIDKRVKLSKPVSEAVVQLVDTLLKNIIEHYLN